MEKMTFAFRFSFSTLESYLYALFEEPYSVNA
jgi:hypothetical protein